MTIASFRAASGAILIMAVSGCAFGNRSTRLFYPPPGTEAPAGGTVVPASGAPAIALQPVKDQRPEPRNVIGAVRNGLGMHTADVLTQDDAAQWATFALRHELEQLGVQVVGEQPGGAVPVLGAELSRVHCNAYMTYQGEVTMRAWIRTGEAYPLNQVYAGAGSSGMNWAATGEGYGECVAKAMQDAARKIAADAKRAAQPAPPPAPAEGRM